MDNKYNKLKFNNENNDNKKVNYCGTTYNHSFTSLEKNRQEYM